MTVILDSFQLVEFCKNRMCSDCPFFSDDDRTCAVETAFSGAPFSWDNDTLEWIKETIDEVLAKEER